MTAYHEHLRQQIAQGPLATEDVLVAVLPLMRQVVVTHERGRVAPLSGLTQLSPHGASARFSESDEHKPQAKYRTIRRMLQQTSGALDVIGNRSVTFDVNAGVVNAKSDDTTDSQRQLDHPAYLCGYLCWEEMVEHHDPATDIFMLGLILASLACGLDLADHDDHKRFVDHRTNLFQIHSGLHPVLARAIMLMTELDRHQRPQDLSALICTLENYRDQAVDFETDLASDLPGTVADRPTKRQVILTKLQERLFEINRRNRLLQFRSTLQTINLTQASVPLSCDVENIRDNQVLTWDGEFRKSLLKQKPVSLNRFLNFRESVYLPGTLDRIRAEARRDETEYGFAQLRLIICFLRWADLKSKPVERYESPLLLLPVRLDVKKGIHDRYSLTANDGLAEVNPVVRHLFKQLYDIDLPDTVEPSESELNAFLDHLRQQIRASDATVELNRVDRPRIEVIHEKAQRRLDQFRKRARLAGRGIRQFMDRDYSYDPINYHPLGIRLFSDFIKPARTHLEDVIGTSAAQPPTAPPQQNHANSSGVESELPPRNDHVASPEEEGNVVEAEQKFYAFSGGDDNPYNWEFDLCSVTLANLKYRRMSLVRDYTQLVTDNTQNAAFESTFSITPVDRSPESSTPVPLADRFHVVACDPTQLQAVSHSRSGHSYIIQGPPGTGKSQTITNLIADFVVRGKRVLFVCEKRAAIDVVYHRLKQQGLSELCCLIHDSQADKKQFVMDLKQTYESFLAEAGKKRDKHSNRRDKIVERLQTALQPLENFNSAMTGKSEGIAIGLRQVLDRLVTLRDDVPELIPREWERIPGYVEWQQNTASLTEFSARLKHVQQDGVLANNPLRLLSSDVADAERPVELVAECLAAGQKLLEQLSARVDQLRLPSEVVTSISQLEEAIDYATKADFLAELDLLPLLDPETESAKTYAKRLKKLQKCDKAIAKARKATVHWKHKLSSEDTRIALQLAQQIENSFTRFLKPAWWKLRSTLNAAYDFSQHPIKPAWTHILGQLDAEHETLANRYDVANTVTDEFGIHTEFDHFHDRLTQLREHLAEQPGPIQSFNRHVLEDETGARTLCETAELLRPLKELCQTLDRFLDGYTHRSLSNLAPELSGIHEALDQIPDYLHCLASLQPLPGQLASAIRTLPLTLTQMEAACAEQSLQTAYRNDRELARFDGTTRTTHITAIAEACDSWQQINADCIREHVRQKFNDHVETASRPAAQLTSEEKEFKKLYNRGRRDIEHEFGKSMRYKAIRELAAGDSGVVIRDIKPVWLMSPLSVSDTLPLSADDFDVVIFDEASQITLEGAIPSLFRAEQTIVVGDEMQLPPTSFFGSRRSDDDEDFSVEEDGEVVQYDLNASSFLNHASRNLPSRMLGWHYRSRSESLISFSNHAFYSGRLLTVPDERLAAKAKQPLLVNQGDEGQFFASELLQRPVSFHFMQDGRYEKRRNRPEADYIAELVRQILLREEGHSIGVVAFSEAQQTEIEQAIKRLADEDADFSELLDLEWEREDDGQFIGLLIKNLENIQGDERDIIIMSVCYGPDAKQKIRMNFGPINQSGGEKRLNVAFSRAKHYMALVSSMKSADITNDYNDGASCLKNYLRYAEACSVGQSEITNSVLRSLSGRDDGDDVRTDEQETIASDIAAELTALGYRIETNVGQSHFRCDLAVYQPDDQTYRLGILIDSPRWYQQTDLLERELMRPQLLQAFGWDIAVVLARDWYHDRSATLLQLTEQLEPRNIGTD